MLSNKTLLKWRKESLQGFNPNEQAIPYWMKMVLERDERILRLTQELMDINLLNKQPQ